MERFEKIYLYRSDTDQVKGVLITNGDSLTFESKKGILVMPKVRSLTIIKGRLRVDYGEAGNYGTARFTDLSKSKFKWKASTRELEGKLRSVLSLAPTTAEDQAGLEAAQQVTKQAAGKRGRVQMAIGAVLAVVGVIITAVTYSNASSNPSGGRYFVAYGPIIFGLLLFFQGFAASRSARR